MGIQEFRPYNLDYKYIKKLIDFSNMSIKDIANTINKTENVINLKFRGFSDLYIHEGILIANKLKMDIFDIFCPSRDDVFSIVYEESFEHFKNFKTREYNEFNFSSSYFKQLLKEMKITLENVCEIWGIKKPALYVRLRGDSKTLLNQAINLSQLLEMDINDVFCPTLDQKKKLFLDNYELIKSDEQLLIDNFFDKNITLNPDYMRFLLKFSNKTKQDVCDIWNTTERISRDKLSGLCTISLKECSQLATFLNLSMSDIILLDDKNELYHLYLTKNE